MRLCAFLRTVYVPSRVELSLGYVEALTIAVRLFSRHLGRDAMLADLTADRVCGFLAAYRAAGFSARSTNNKRSMLLTLWTAAWQHGMLAAPPQLWMIRRIPEEVDPPEAWTQAEVSALLAETRMVGGEIAGIPACDWWTSLLLTIYWTSCRIGALLDTPCDCYQSGGLLVRRQKNRRPQWYRLPDSCCHAIDATEPQTRQLLWPWDQHRRQVYVKVRAIVEAAGLPCPRRARQLFHRLRRTTLSLCAAVDPAIAQRQAGHSDYRTTQRHYIDPRIARGQSAADILPDPMPSRPTLTIYG